MKGAWVAALGALSLMVLTELPAQRAQSVEMGYLTIDEDALFLVGYRVMFAPKGAGVDFSIATWPEGIPEGGLLLFPHLDVTAPIAVGSRAWLLPRAGLSAIIGASVGSGGGGGALAGYNVGIGLMGRMSERHGLRFDVTHMRLIGDDADEGIGLTTFSIGFAWIK